MIIELRIEVNLPYVSEALGVPRSECANRISEISESLKRHLLRYHGGFSFGDGFLEFRVIAADRLGYKCPELQKGGE